MYRKIKKTHDIEEYRHMPTYKCGTLAYNIADATVQ